MNGDGLIDRQTDGKTESAHKNTMQNTCTPPPPPPPPPPFQITMQHTSTSRTQHIHNASTLGSVHVQNMQHTSTSHIQNECNASTLPLGPLGVDNSVSNVPSNNIANTLRTLQKQIIAKRTPQVIDVTNDGPHGCIVLPTKPIINAEQSSSASFINTNNSSINADQSSAASFINTNNKVVNKPDVSGSGSDHKYNRNNYQKSVGSAGLRLIQAASAASSSSHLHQHLRTVAHDRQTDRKTDRETDRQTDRETPSISITPPTYNTSGLNNSNSNNNNNSTVDNASIKEGDV